MLLSTLLHSHGLLFTPSPLERSAACISLIMSQAAVHDTITPAPYRNAGDRIHAPLPNISSVGQIASVAGSRRAAELMGNVATTTRFPGSDATRAAQAYVIAMFRQLSEACAPVMNASAHLSVVYGGVGRAARMAGYHGGLVGGGSMLPRPATPGCEPFVGKDQQL